MNILIIIQLLLYLHKAYIIKDSSCSQPNHIKTHPDTEFVSEEPRTRLRPDSALFIFLQKTEIGTGWKASYEAGYYGDGSGHKTYGYGLLFHPLLRNTYMDQYKSRYTREELEELFRLSVYHRYNLVVDWAHSNRLELNNQMLCALTSLVYNCGGGILRSELGELIKSNPYDPRIINQWKTTSSHLFQRFPGLRKRRIAEINMYYGWGTS